MREIALFSGKIYTAGTNFTRPPVVTVATNLNSVDTYQMINDGGGEFCESFCLLQEMTL